MSIIPHQDLLAKGSKLPKRITEVTDAISKGASKVHGMTTRMDAAIKKIPNHNPVSGAVVTGLAHLSGALDTGAAGIDKLAGNIKNAGTGIAATISPIANAAESINKSLTDLQNCTEVLDSASKVVDAIIHTATGHFHPQELGSVLGDFDQKWDSWANVVNKTFEILSPTGQKNVLMDLATANFSPSVIALGSAIKNNSAGIFYGIADFESSLHSFRGSYHNPIESAKKIETGVKGIARATETVANSIKNLIQSYQNGVGATPVNNPILDYFANLHDSKAIVGLNKVLTVAGAPATLLSDYNGLVQSWNSKNLKSIYSSAKKTIGDVSNIAKGLKKSSAATRVTSLDSASQGAANNSSGTSGQTSASSIPTAPQQSNSLQSSNGTDSYVCSGATMRCTMGTSQAQLTVLPLRTVYLTGQPMANISDHLTMINLAPFGRCRSLGYPATASATAAAHGKLTPMPCVHNTPMPWMAGKNDYLVKGQPALLKSSTCSCMWGGTISITKDGQVNTGAPDMSRGTNKLFPKNQQCSKVQTIKTLYYSRRKHKHCQRVLEKMEELGTEKAYFFWTNNGGEYASELREELICRNPTKKIVIEKLEEQERGKTMERRTKKILNLLSGADFEQMSWDERSEVFQSLERNPDAKEHIEIIKKYQQFKSGKYAEEASLSKENDNAAIFLVVGTKKNNSGKIKINSDSIWRQVEREILKEAGYGVDGVLLNGSV